MKRLSQSRMVLAITLALAWASASWSQPAQPAHADEDMALRGIMQQLGRDMQAITAAISLENWARVAELAPRIAGHEQPPASEKLRILGWLGSDAGTFRNMDGDVEQAATALGDAAQRGDGEEVIAHFARTQQGCLACHQAYRQPFIDHFYESP